MAGLRTSLIAAPNPHPNLPPSVGRRAVFLSIRLFRRALLVMLSDWPTLFAGSSKSQSASFTPILSFHCFYFWCGSRRSSGAGSGGSRRGSGATLALLVERSVKIASATEGSENGDNPPEIHPINSSSPVPGGSGPRTASSGYCRTWQPSNCTSEADELESNNRRLQRAGKPRTSDYESSDSPGSSDHCEDHVPVHPSRTSIPDADCHISAEADIAPHGDQQGEADHPVRQLPWLLIDPKTINY